MLLVGMSSVERRFAPPSRQRRRAAAACYVAGSVLLSLACNACFTCLFGPQGKKAAAARQRRACLRCSRRLPARGCFRRRQPPHHAPLYASSWRRCVGRSRASQQHSLSAGPSAAELWARTAARSLVRVGVHIIDLHVAAIHKLLKLRFDRMSVGGSRTGPLRAATGRRRGELPSRRRFAFVSGRGVALLCCIA